MGFNRRRGETDPFWRRDDFGRKDDHRQSEEKTGETS